MPEADAEFMQLVRPCWVRLHVVARHYAASREDALDLVQDTLLRAWGSYSPGETRRYREGWLFVIMRRVAAEWARIARRRINLVTLEHDELTELAPTPLTDRLEAMPSMTEERFREFLDDGIRAAFDALEPIHREVLLLSVAAGLDYREIAQDLDCPVGTVMSRMARARRALRERLASSARTRAVEPRR